ncbi:MAG: flagellar hook-associated protein 3 [Spirochaetia bacterium]
MVRISSAMERNQFSHYNRLNEVAKNRTQKQVDSQYRIGLLRDDPTSAAHSIRFQSKQTRLAKYELNAQNTINNYSIVEGNMAQAVDLMQRVRELAVQGANGTYSKEDLRYMAVEVNQYLEELVNLSNQRGADGLSLFSGTRTEGAAFREIRGNVDGAQGLVITGVEYIGNNASREVEYSDGSRIDAQFAGNNVFWAENQKIWSANRVDGFVVPEDTSIIIDNTEIALRAGDSIHSLIERINQADVAVKASIDPVENSLVLTSTTPHQIWLSDAENGSVLLDLGILSDAQRKSPNNLAPGSRVAGGSMFDMMIQLRDAMYDGDQMKIGGSTLGGIDMAMDNLNVQRATLGSQESRLRFAVQRLSYENNSYKEWDNVARGLNMAQALTDLSALDTAMQATYRVAATTLKTTLMDFLR